jgi:hypothetical protein
MKKGLYLLPAIFVLTILSLAQVASEPGATSVPDQGSSPKAQNPGAPADALASGTILSVELSKSLDAKKAKANDRIEAKTATDLLAHGQIVVPRNTKIIGHVTEAKTRSKISPDSLVGITFDRMLLKDGREIPLQVTVQAIARPLQLGPSLMGNTPPADNPAGAPMTMPGQRAPLGGSASGTGVTSPYPTAADRGPPPDPMAPNGSTVSPLSPTSRGVVGMKGLSLETSGAVSVLSSNTGNVHLDDGTQLILRVQ